jgi:hypothetical protein
MKFEPNKNWGMEKNQSMVILAYATAELELVIIHIKLEWTSPRNRS